MRIDASRDTNFAFAGNDLGRRTDYQTGIHIALRQRIAGLTDPDVSLAASLVLYGAYSLKYPAALNGLQFLNGSFLTQPFQLEDGALRVPAGPGLGATVDEDKVRKASAEFEKEIQR